MQDKQVGISQNFLEGLRRSGSGDIAKFSIIWWEVANICGLCQVLAKIDRKPI